MDREIRLAPVALDIEASADRPRRFTMVAYTGATMDVGWGAPVVMNLSGMQPQEKARPILKDHNPSLIVGHTESVSVVDGVLRVAGVVSGGGAVAREIVDAGLNGFPWQASIGARVAKSAFVPEGKSVEVNGQSVSGPVYHVSEWALSEVSFVALGADDGTSAKLAARAAGRKVNMDENGIRANERERVASIEAACRGEWGNKAGHVAELKAKATDGEISVDELRAEMLELMRSQRPVLRGQSGRDSTVDVSAAAVIEAALLRRSGFGHIAEKAFDERTLEAAQSSNFVTALDTCRYALQADGRDIPASRERIVANAISTGSMSVAMENTLGRVLLDTYTDAASPWRAFARTVEVPNFKSGKSVRPSLDTELEPVAPGGEIKHFQFSQDSVVTWNVDTYGKMLAVDRRDLINDDLGFINSLVATMGPSAARALNDLIVTTLLGGQGTFFSTGNKNYLTGSTTNLGIDSLSLAIRTMRSQRDASNRDLDLQPSVLLVPPSLEYVAKQALQSEFVAQTAAQTPTGNPMRNALQLVVEPRLENNARFASGTSSKAWYLFTAPTSYPAMLVGFLQGMTAPTVEEAPSDFNMLGRQFRVYWDFGATLLDPRAAVRVKGEA